MLRACLPVLCPKLSEQLELFHTARNTPDFPIVCTALIESGILTQLWGPAGDGPAATVDRRDLLVDLIESVHKDSLSKVPSIFASPGASGSGGAASTALTFSPRPSPAAQLLTAVLHDVLSSSKHRAQLSELDVLCVVGVLERSRDLLVATQTAAAARPPAELRMEVLSQVLSSSLVGVALPSVLALLHLLFTAPSVRGASAPTNPSVGECVRKLRQLAPELLVALGAVERLRSDSGGDEVTLDSVSKPEAWRVLAESLQLSDAVPQPVGSGRVLESPHPFVEPSSGAATTVTIDNADALRLEFDPRCSRELAGKKGVLVWGANDACSEEGWPRRAVLIRGKSVCFRWQVR